MSELRVVQDQHALHSWLEEHYRTWNRKEFIHPDPLEFVLRFDNPADQEVAGLIASGLAYGRVGQILKSLEKVFDVLKCPSEDVRSTSRKELSEAFGSFRHRWTTGEELTSLMRGIALLRDEFGSLGDCFAKGMEPDDRDVIPALANFVSKLRFASGRRDSSLLACPTMGSACKRMFLYLRWMARCDEVDPGPWKGISASRLVVPMDVHMHRVSRNLGLTTRRQADLKCALEVTGFFRQLVPDDPVKYDFALTRPGIRSMPGTKDTDNPIHAENVHL